MIKSSKLSLLSSNTNRLNDISSFLKEYKKIVEFFVDHLWDLEIVPKLIEKEVTGKAQTWLSKRAVQCCAKQASGIIRGTRAKQKKRLYKYNEFIEKGMFKKARKLKAFIDEQSVSKPNIKSLQAELDSRFIKMDFENETSFDGWITLSCLGEHLKIELPVKKTKHFNLMNKTGILKHGIRLSENKATFMFDMPEVPNKEKGSILGLDIGIKNVYSTSDNQQSGSNKDGWDLDQIQQRLSRRRKGSKAFGRTQSHRKNYVNWSINKLNLDSVRVLKLEDIKHLRRGHKSSRYLTHWTYTAIYDKLEDYCSQRGVHVEKISPTYTSQRCSQCGWVRKNNRRGKLFKCSSCSYESDADLNASKNIVLDLPSITKAQRLKHENRQGFYWSVLDQEFRR